MSHMNTNEILTALKTVRAPALPGEYDLHGMIADALAHSGIAFVHECPIAPRRRIDFLAGTIGIEVKKGRPDRRTLLAQITRYLESGRLSEIVVVMQRAVSLPERVLGRRVTVVSLNRLWGVALP